MAEPQPQEAPPKEKRGFGRGGAGGDRGGHGGDRGGRGGDRGGRGGKRGGPPRKREEEEWIPVTKLGRLVKAGKVGQIEEIFRFSIPIKESQIVDYYFKEKLKDEVMEIKSVQKQTQAGQRTRFKAFVVVGAIKGAILDAKLNLVPVRRGYWGNKIGKPHTVPTKVTGKGGSVRVRLIPAPRGTGIVGAPTPKKILQFAGIQDCYTSSQGNTKTKGNFLKATFAALEETYMYLTPDMWGETREEPTLIDMHSKWLNAKDEK